METSISTSPQNLSGVIAMAAATCLTGCAAHMANMTSGQIGCPREEIVVYNDYTRWGSSNWTAECRGRTYFCSAVTGSISCMGQPTEASLESSGRETAPVSLSMTVAGCRFDNQCKGARVCVSGECVAPSSASVVGTDNSPRRSVSTRDTNTTTPAPAPQGRQVALKRQDF